jgi:hypothetical protein
MTAATIPSVHEIARSLAELAHPPADLPHRLRDVYGALLAQSPRIREGNFSVISPPDLALLFDLYDLKLFGSRVRQLLHLQQAPLSFHLSARLTRSAGLTKRFAPRKPRPGLPAPAARYEIVISTTLLYQTFTDVHRTVRVNGLICRDRLEALQRIFEHELLHLIEMLVWGRSSCAADNFKVLAWNYFGHTETKHDLVTQHERALTKFDVRVGDRVTFEFDGVQHTGVVNRITRRATILVESTTGQPYSDGKRYLKFYVPLPLLTRAGE